MSVHRYAALWDETVRVFDEMVVKESWSNRTTVDVSDINPLTNRVRILISYVLIHADECCYSSR